MKRIRLALIWLTVYLLLVMVYSQSTYTISEAIYFVSMLFPVVLGTSYFFNYILVPKYLLKGRYKTFGLYVTYLLIVSIYLETWVILLSLILLADYNYTQLSPAIDDIVNMAILLYAVVFIHGFTRLFIHFQTAKSEREDIGKVSKSVEPKSFVIISNRKKVRLVEANVTYIESLGDYVKIHLKAGDTVLTKVTISRFEGELSADFIRIHRSFLVNISHVQTFSSDKLQVNGTELNITRKYKKSVLEVLQS